MRANVKDHTILQHKDSIMEIKRATMTDKKRQTMAVARLSGAEQRAMVRPSAAGLALAARSAALAHAAAWAATLEHGNRRRRGRHTDVHAVAEHSAPERSRHDTSRRQAAVEDAAVQALKRLVVLEGCSERFFTILAGQCERLSLTAGASREVSSNHIIGAQRRPAFAVLVDKGTLRIEAGGMLIDEIGPGYCFGMANVMASVSGNTTREALGIATEFLMRCHAQSEGCHCLLFSNVAFRHALTQCPDDKARLFKLLHMVSCNGDITRDILATLQCSEVMASTIAKSLTRHIRMPGDVVIQEGRRTPEGLVLLRSGTVQLEMGGVMVRRVSEGQVMGQEMMFGVCHKWASTARCLAPCDIQILHRRLFVSLVREMNDSNSEELESRRLLLLLEGRWKEERAILSWPLFRGYSTAFISALGRLIETRVVLPAVKVWENGMAHQEGREVALYFILHGSCEEELMSDRISRKADDSAGADKVGADGRSIKRVLAPGTCMGEREFLGFQEANTVVVKARRICLVAVLHRNVFLHAVDEHPSETQSEEVKRLLEHELDQTEPPLVQGLHEKIIRGLPLFRGCDRRFVERLCEKVRSSYFIGGQTICRNGVEAKEMLIVARGEVIMTLAGLEIRRYVRGKALNILSLSEYFAPAYALSCERACEVWTLARSEFMGAVEDFPLDRRRLSVLFGHEGVAAVNHDMDGNASRRVSMAFLDQAPFGHRMPDDLDKVEVLSGCSAAMLRWIRDHMETTVCFPDETIYREGSEDESMYIICSGMVIVQGMKDSSQVSLSRGACFGEQRLLEVHERAKATVTAVETTVLQVLHRCVLVKGLERFPDDASHFDRVAISWLNASDVKDLKQAPLFSSCSAEFLTQVAKSLQMRLIRKGGILNEGNPAGECLCILRSGAAVAEERTVGLLMQPARGDAGQPRHFTENSAVNAGVVLGMIRRPGPLIRAERVCIVADMLASRVLAALQGFPREVERVVKAAAGGTLWPSGADDVPLFRGMGSAFFSKLLEVSRWVLYLPDQIVVKQNGIGHVLFLLCYGTAINKVDGVAVGHPLSSGDAVGTANFLRVSNRYRTTVRTQSVCHFRTMTALHLDEVLPEHVAERERVEILRQQVQQKLAKEEEVLHIQASREKLKHRADGAFRRHIAVVRGQRNFTPPPGIARAHPPRGSGAQEGRHLPARVAGSEGESSDVESELESRASDESSRRHRPGSLGHHHGKSLSAVQRAGAAHGAAHRGRWLFTAPQGIARASSSASPSNSAQSGTASAEDSGSEQWGRSSSSSDECSGSSGEDSDSGSDSAIDHQGSNQTLIAGAIMDYTEGKKTALLKARVLRLYHSGMPLDGATHSTPRLASPELELLQEVLPPLVPREPPPGSAKGSKLRSKDRDRLLQARFQELTAPPSTAQLPGTALKRSP